MRIARQIPLMVLSIGLIGLFTSCNINKKALAYKYSTEAFIETLLEEDYDHVLDHFAMEHELFKDTDKDTLREKLIRSRALLVENLGTELSVKTLKWQKRYSTSEELSTPKDVTEVLMEIANTKDYGVFRVLFDDKSGKILHMESLILKKPIPNMSNLWLYGLISLCVPLLNILALVLVWRSDFKGKWLKYIFILLFNIPTIFYSPANGVRIEFLHIEFLLGIGFSYMGYELTVLKVGIPLGALYWLWKTKQRQRYFKKMDAYYAETQPSTS